jgi:hypothetical protein
MYRNLFASLTLAGTIGTSICSCNRVGESVKSQPAPVETAKSPSFPRPQYLKPVIDLSSNTSVTRIADQAAFNSNLSVLRHNYAKNQPWNADESYLLLNFQYPAALLDGRTYKFLRWVRQPSQSVWSNLNPALMYGMVADTNQFVKLDLAKGDTYTVLRQFREYDRIDFGSWEGNLSNNDRYAALIGVKAGKLDLLVYDLISDRVVSRKTQPKGTTFGNSGTTTIDNITMSQSGKYVIVQYNKPGKGVQSGIQLLDRSLKFVRQLSTGKGGHYDSCVDSKGSESIVITNDTNRSIVSVGYATGKKTTLLSAAKASYSIHISCRNLKRPGWVYISEFAGDLDPGTVKATPDRTFALNLNGSGTTEQFARPNNSLNKAYERQTQSVPNRDGSKVIFASDWGNPTDPVYSYISQKKPRSLR